MWSRFGGKDVKQILEETQAIKSLELVCTSCETCIEFIPNSFRMDICRRCRHPASAHVPIEQLPGPRARQVRRKRDEKRRMTSTALRKERMKESTELRQIRWQKQDRDSDEEDSEEESLNSEDEAKKTRLLAEKDKAYAAVNKKIFLAFKSVDMPRILEVVESTIDRDMLNYEDAYGNTPLIVGCRAGLYRSVRKLIILGADRNYENKFGITPLIAAVQSSSTKTCQELLSRTYPSDPASTIYVTKLRKTCREYLPDNPRAREKLLQVLDMAPQVKAQKILDLEEEERQRRIAEVAKKVVDLREEKEMEMLEQIGAVVEEFKQEGIEESDLKLWEMEEKQVLLDKERELLAENGITSTDHGRSAAMKLALRAVKVAKMSTARLTTKGFEKDSIDDIEDEQEAIAQRAKADAIASRKKRKTRWSVGSVSGGVRASTVVGTLWNKQSQLNNGGKHIPLRPRNRVEAALRIQGVARIYLARKKRQRELEHRKSEAREMRRTTHAALFLQRHARVFRDRKKVAERRKQRDAALVIQRIWRGWQDRRAFLILIRLHRKFQQHDDNNEVALFKSSEKERNAAKLIQRVVRKQRVLSNFSCMLNQSRAAFKIQRIIRGRVLAPLAVSRRKQEIALQRLAADTFMLEDAMRILELKQQIRHAQTISRVLKPLADRANKDRVIPNVVTIQRVARGYLGRQRHAELTTRRLFQIGLLEGCLKVRGLVAIAGRNGETKQLKIGPSGSYGYCGKCPCRKYLPRVVKPIVPEEDSKGIIPVGLVVRPSVLHICDCGHHITNHALNAARLEMPDFYDTRKDRIVQFRTGFHNGQLHSVNECHTGNKWIPAQQVSGGAPLCAPNIPARGSATTAICDNRKASTTTGYKVPPSKEGYKPLPKPNFPKSNSIFAQHKRRDIQERKEKYERKRAHEEVQKEIELAWERRAQVLKEQRASLAEKNNRYIDDVEVKVARRNARRWSELERKREKAKLEKRNREQAQLAREEKYQQHLAALLEQQETLTLKRQQVELDRKYRRKKQEIVRQLKSGDPGTLSLNSADQRLPNVLNHSCGGTLNGDQCATTKHLHRTEYRHQRALSKLSVDKQRRIVGSHTYNPNVSRHHHTISSSSTTTGESQTQSEITQTPLLPHHNNSISETSSFFKPIRRTKPEILNQAMQQQRGEISNHQLDITQARMVKAMLSPSASKPCDIATKSSYCAVVSVDRKDIVVSSGYETATMLHGNKNSCLVPLTHNRECRFTIGRSRTSDIVVESGHDSSALSKQHIEASYTVCSGMISVQITDKGTTNGTTVNSMKLPKGGTWSSKPIRGDVAADSYCKRNQPLVVVRVGSKLRIHLGCCLASYAIE